MKLNTLTIENSSGATFNNTVTANTFNTSNGSTSSLNYALALLNGAMITNVMTFTNTGGFTLGGTALFTAGVTSTASTTTLQGKVYTSGAGITLGTTILNASSNIDSTNNGATTTGSAISVGAITDNSTSANLTLNAGTTGTVNVTSLSNGGVLTLSNSDGATFTGTVNATQVNISDSQSGTNVLFQNNLTDSGTFGATNSSNSYNVQLEGASNAITGASTIANKGTVTIGTTATNTNTFSGGVTATNASNVNIAGSISAAGANVIDLASPVTVTANTSIGGATGQITLGATSIQASNSLALGNDLATPISVSSISGSAAGHGTVVVSTSGTFAASGVIGLTNSLNTFTLENAGTASFSNTVNATTFNSSDGNTNSLAYGLTFSNGANIINAVTFSNTGGVSLTGNLQFNGGVTSTASTTTLNGTLTTHGNIINLGNTTLAGTATTLDTTNASANATGANVTIGTVSGTSTGVQGLAITAGTAGNVNLNGTVGTASDALSSVSVTANKTTINNASTYTTGAQAYTGAVALASNTSVNSSASNISFNNTVDGGFELDATAQGNVTFAQNVGQGTNLAKIVATAGTGSKVNINGANVDTTGAQSYHGAVNLGATTNLASTGGAVSFSNSIDGAVGLTVSGSSVTFNGNIGNGTPLISLMVTGPTTLNTGVIKTTTSQNFVNAVTLTGGNVLTAGTSIDFQSTIDGNQALSVSAPTVTLGQSIGSGSNSALTSLTVLGTTLNDNAAVINTSGAQTYQNAMVLDVGSDLTSTAGAINIESNANGAFALQVNALAGGVTLGNTTASSANLASLSVTGPTTLNWNAVNTTNAQNYAGALTLGSSTDVVSSASSVTFANTIDGAFALIANGSTGVTLSNSIGNTAPLTSLDVTGATTVNSAVINTTGAETYHSAVTLTHSSQMSSNTNGNITFDASIDGGANNLTTSTGTATTAFYGALSDINTLAVTSSTINLENGNVTTTGNQTYTGAVTLENAASLTSSNSGTITLSSTVANNGNTLTLATAGTATIVGQISGAGGLTQAGTGTLQLDSSLNNYTGATTIQNGILQVAANNALAVASAVTLDSGAVLNLNNFNNSISDLYGAGNVTLGSSTLTVNNSDSDSFDGNISGTGNVIKTNSGTLTLDGNNSYSGGTHINVGTINAASNTALGTNFAIVAAGAELDVSNSVTLSNQIGLTGNGITTNGALVATGTDILSGGVSLGANTSIGVTNSGDTLTLNNIISGADLNKVGAGTLVITNANNSYTGMTNVKNGVISIGAATAIPLSSALNIGSAASVTFNNLVVSVPSLTGSGTLNLTTASIQVGSDNSNSSYSGNIIGTGILDKLGTGTLTLTGNNAYSGITAVTSGTVVFQSGASSVGIINVSNNASLVLNNATVTSTQISLNGTGVGSAGALVDSGNSILSGSVNLSTNSTISTTSGSDTLVLRGSVNGAKTLTLQGPGNISLVGGVGTTTPLNTILSNAGTTTTSGAVNTIYNQSYNNVVSLYGNTTLTSSAGKVTLGGAIDGNNSLSVSSNSGTVINGVIGGHNALSSLTVTDGSGASVSTTLNGGAITTVGNQSFNDPIILGANTTLTSGGNITIPMGITGANDNLSLIGSNLSSPSSSNSSLGSANNNNFILAGNIAVNNVVVTGNSAGINTLTVQSNDANQVWNINGANQGSISGITEQTGSFTYSSMNNLVGGDNGNTFSILGGGSVTGSITGGAGVNTFIADNVNNTFNLSGANSGTGTGVGSFKQIQNIVGGTGTNTFVLADGASVGGTLSATGTQTNTIDYSAYSAPMNVTLNGASGQAVNGANSPINNFNNINNLIGNGQSVLTVDGTNNVIYITGANQGYVNDPTYFSGFNTIGATNGASSSTIVKFNTTAELDANTEQAYINGITLTFVNIDFVGSFLNQIAASLNSAINSSMQGISTGDNTDPSSSVSADGNYLFSGSPGESAMNVTISVTNNVATCSESIANGQSNTDLKVTGSVKIKSNCQ